MADNIFSHSTSPSFTRQAIDEYFIQPMFMAEDIRGLITVRTDVKGTERLNRIYRPSFLTKPKLVPGFNPQGEFSLQYQDITVKPMGLEFEQNARAFWGSILEQLLASGYKEDDVEQMKSPDVWNKIMLPLIAQAGQDDLIRQMFFANPIAEIFDGSSPAGEIDNNYSGYTGFMTHFYNAVTDGVFLNRHIPVASAVVAKKQEIVLTLTYGATTTSITIRVNGVDYNTNYNGTAAQTMTDWFNQHSAAISNRAGINGVVVTNPSPGAIKIVSKCKGGVFSYSSTAFGGGSFAESAAVAAVKAGSLAANEADTTFESMLDAITPEMHEFELNFMITSSLWRNLVHTMKNRPTGLGDAVLKNGAKVPSYEGIPIIIRPDWDKWITIANAGVQPHRAILTTPKNLLFATDGTTDSEMIESWYNQEAQVRRYRVQYKAQTAFLHPELVVLAGFTD